MKKPQKGCAGSARSLRIAWPKGSAQSHWSRFASVENNDLIPWKTNKILPLCVMNWCISSPSSASETAIQRSTLDHLGAGSHYFRQGHSEVFLSTCPLGIRSAAGKLWLAGLLGSVYGRQVLWLSEVTLMHQPW